jgi:outer membrane lipoprotein carrier protein
LDPEKKIALLLGDRTALYLEDDRQLTRSRLRGDQGMFPRLIAGRDRIDELFTASVIATPSGGGRGSYRLRLVPRGASAALGEVTLTLRPPAYSIEAAELVDEAGNRTTYTFSDMRRNRALPEGLFAFEPPPGTEIVDE